MFKQEFDIVGYAGRLGAAVVWATLLAPAWAEEQYGPNFDTGSSPLEVALPFHRGEPLPFSTYRDPAAPLGQPPAQVPRPHPNSRSSLPPNLRLSPFGPPAAAAQPSPNYRSSLPPASRPSPFGPPASPPFASRQGRDRLPERQASTPTRGPFVGPVRPSEEPADGTWREEGRHIIINLHGQEMRLVREEAPAQDQDATPGPAEPSGGTVYGRLLNQGRPLASCQVRILPLAKGFTGYSPDRAGRSFTATTDAQGAYRFENVPAGAYKLSWLPDGTNQWIRRISMRPDVMVQAEKAARAKDIRTALRTIN